MLALFGLFIARKSFIVLLALGSAFYWLIVLLLLGAVFRAWTPFDDNAGVHAVAVLVSVIVEQCANYGLHRLNGRLIEILREVGRKLGHGFTSLDALWLSFGMGFGHGATHLTFFFVSLLEATSKDGTAYDFETCPQLSFNTTSALLALGFALFHTFSTIVFFEGLTNKDRIQSFVPPLTHLSASMLTLINFGQKGCLATIPLILAIGVGSILWAMHLVWSEIKRQFPAERVTTT